MKRTFALLCCIALVACARNTDMTNGSANETGNLSSSESISLDNTGMPVQTAAAPAKAASTQVDKYCDTRSSIEQFASTNNYNVLANGTDTHSNIGYVEFYRGTRDKMKSSLLIYREARSYKSASDDDQLCLVASIDGAQSDGDLDKDFGEGYDT